MNSVLSFQFSLFYLFSFSLLRFVPLCLLFCSSVICFLWRPHRTYLDTDAALGTNIIVNCHHILDHADGNHRAQIYAPATTCTLVRINSDHAIPPY